MKVHCAHKKMVQIDQIKENPNNPNVHPKEQIDMLSDILKSNGWRLPITVSNRSGFIVRGHGRLMAAKRAGIKTVPVDYQDYDSDEEELADLLADNKIPELSFLDTEKTNQILSSLMERQFDIAMAGFNQIDIEKMMEDVSKLAEIEPKEDGSKITMGEKRYQIKPVLYVDQINVFERAIAKTGEINRGNAIMKICEAYLDE